MSAEVRLTETERELIRNAPPYIEPGDERTGKELAVERILADRAARAAGEDGLRIPAAAKLKPGDLIRVLDDGWELADEDGLRAAVEALADEGDRPKMMIEYVGWVPTARLRAVLARHPVEHGANVVEGQ